MKKGIVFYYLGNKTKVVKVLQQYLSDQGITLMKYEIEQNPPENMEYLLLLEPIQIHTKWYSVSTIWKNWLLDHHPNVKLISAGFTKSNHLNVLSLLELPANMHEWLKKVRPARDYVFQAMSKKAIIGHKRYEYRDTWENYPLPLGINIKGEIERFLVGHESAPQKIWNFVNILSDLHERLKGLTAKQIQEKDGTALILILERWEHYKTIFRYLPFYLSVQSIMDKLFLIQRRLTNTNNDQQHSFEKDIIPIDIREKLYTEVHRYVYYEDYW